MSLSECEMQMMTQTKRNRKRTISEETNSDDDQSGTIHSDSSCTEQSPDDMIHEDKRLKSQNECECNEAMIQKMNRILSKLHEHVSPKYTSKERIAFGIEAHYGGITGTLTPAALVRIISLMLGKHVPGSKYLFGSTNSSDNTCVLNEDSLFQANESIFCDIGSGTGRPVFYVASTGIKASIGFDIDPMQVFNSQHGKRILSKRSNSDMLKCPVGFFQADVTRIQNLDPVTHVYAFLGYTGIINATVQLVARSLSVKLFVAVVLHDRELRDTGILCEDENAQIIMVSGLQMPGGNSYSAYLIPMTTRRRSLVKRILGQPRITPKLQYVDFTTEYTTSLGTVDESKLSHTYETRTRIKTTKYSPSKSS